MSTTIRATATVAIFAAVVITAAACSASSGPLGTPAAPASSAVVSGEPTPPDVVAATPSPTPAPSIAPSPAPSGSAGSATTQPTVTPPATPTPSPAGTTIVRAYFMLGSLTDNPGLVPVLRTVPETKAVAKAAMTALLGGPKGAELETSPAMYTSIPDETRLLDITIKNGVATVNLSTEFKGAAASFQGGTATAQVVYTVTQFPTVELVRIEIDGVASGGALGRSDFQWILPAIFVDRPAWGASAGNPVRLSGIANVFEAQFRVQVLDGDGNLLADEPVTASCGTGCWGSFNTRVGYGLAKAQYGTLRVFEPSAKDGSPINVTEYRVWLTP